jgi:hypothetical protein
VAASNGSILNLSSETAIQYGDRIITLLRSLRPLTLLPTTNARPFAAKEGRAADRPSTLYNFFFFLPKKKIKNPCVATDEKRQNAVDTESGRSLMTIPLGARKFYGQKISFELGLNPDNPTVQSLGAVWVPKIWRLHSQQPII